MKFEVLEELKSKMETPNMLKLDSLTVKFCGKGEDPPHADVNCFPVMIHSCPDDFSTLDYFDVSLYSVRNIKTYLRKFAGFKN